MMAVIKDKTKLLTGEDLIEWMEAICFPFSMDDYPSFFAKKKNDRMKVKAFSQLRSRPKPQSSILLDINYGYKTDFHRSTPVNLPNTSMTHAPRTHVNREQEDSFGRVSDRADTSGDETISDEENTVIFDSETRRELEESKECEEIKEHHEMEPQPRYLTHAHEDLPRGPRILHHHICEVC